MSILHSYKRVLLNVLEGDNIDSAHLGGDSVAPLESRVLFLHKLGAI
jgi:hypothetical protein